VTGRGSLETLMIRASRRSTTTTKVPPCVPSFSVPRTSQASPTARAVHGWNDSITAWASNPRLSTKAASAIFTAASASGTRSCVTASRTG